MLPYILLIIIAFLCSFCSYNRSSRRVSTITIGNSNNIKENNLCIAIFFLLLFTIMSLRDITIGVDLVGYKAFFLDVKDMQFKNAITKDSDFLYIVLNWIIGQFTNDFQVFLAIVTALTLLPVCIQYSRERRHAFLKIVLFMNMPIFIMFFSGLRQSLAMAVTMVSFEFVKKKRFLPFIITSLIAMGFHHSAFIVFSLYPLYFLRIRKKQLFIVVPLVGVVFVFNRQIFSYLTILTSSIWGNKYDVDISSTNAYAFIILFALFVLLSYIITDERTMDDERVGLRNYMLFALFLQCFALVHTLAMRMNYYFIIFIPMAVSETLNSVSLKNRKIVKLVELVIIVFFLYYYIDNMYKMCLAGGGSLGVYPYKLFFD